MKHTVAKHWMPFLIEFHGLQYKNQWHVVCCMLHVLSVLGGKIWKLHRDLEWCTLLWFVLNHCHYWGISHVVWLRCPILCTCSVSDIVPCSKWSKGWSVQSLLNTTVSVFLCLVEQLMPCVMTSNFMTNISWWVTL